ncbi:hypothetical protein BPOR_1141g00020 [Botrytis porri]|uniref:Uncharacterized protein n=1 Tax=Botrytis porri TaxID=87229 RepID=A0A4Z1K5P5_9HELO|nr:hypothetical protein BPOR_1141g00020 [Botrytis porri]
MLEKAEVIGIVRRSRFRVGSEDWNAFMGTALEPTREVKIALKRAVKSNSQTKTMTMPTQASLTTPGTD